jgi:phage tail sheath protein FI
MAISTPLQSPGIFVREIDLTGVVPNVPTSTGAFVGEFNWGPVEEPVLISNESGLVEVFGSPDSDNTVEWHSAAYFLRYSNELQVVRVVASATNAYDSDADSASPPLVKNRDNFDDQIAALADSDHSFIAKYPGDAGNSISVHYVTADSSGTTDFDAWTYKSSFDAAPKTSTWATAASALNDEAHVVVVDRLGEISGTRGSVLEIFPFVSLAKGALKEDGSSNYILDVINNGSNYVWMAGFGAAGKFSALAGTNVSSSKNYAKTGTVTKTVNFVGGANGSAIGTSEYATGFDLFEDKEALLVDFLIAPGLSSRADQTTVVNDLVTIAGSTRKDCVVVTSPARSDIIGNASPVTDSVTTANTFTSSSYLIVDNNYLKVYDKYNDQYIWIPAASSVAGIMASTDAVAAPWFSPAGPRRGQVLGVTSLAYSPNQSQRDTLYKAGINPIANIPGQGVLLYGDKTKLARPSAFDRINVRRLFLGIERAVSVAARNVMFEFNDEFTRAEFKNIIEPFLREIQGRRGITDFRVVCDETNNTPAVIDRNEFVCSLFIKPARSINYVTLNFVAVRTGVDFAEVVGTV